MEKRKRNKEKPEASTALQANPVAQSEASTAPEANPAA